MEELLSHGPALQVTGTFHSRTASVVPVHVWF